MGPHFIAAGVEFAGWKLGAKIFRTTVAEFNQRALRACEKTGFERMSVFTNTDSERKFVILIKKE
jgi:RimJ/RimL family protein N-acetyltransferase